MKGAYSLTAVPAPLLKKPQLDGGTFCVPLDNAFAVVFSPVVCSRDRPAFEGAVVCTINTAENSGFVEAFGAY